jgi:hypothetical protein
MAVIAACLGWRVAGGGWRVAADLMTRLRRNHHPEQHSPCDPAADLPPVAPFTARRAAGRVGCSVRAGSQFIRRALVWNCRAFAPVTCSFKRPLAHRPKGFSSQRLSLCGAGCRSL